LNETRALDIRYFVLQSESHSGPILEIVAVAKKNQLAMHSSPCRLSDRRCCFDAQAPIAYENQNIIRNFTDTDPNHLGDAGRRG
jgi:hypothetical protein